MTTVTIVSEGCVTRASAEPGAEDLWLAPPVLRASTGWALEPAGLCRGPACVPIPPGRQTEFVRGDGAVNLAALARQRGQAAVHDDEGRVWVFGAPSLADAHGRKVVLIAWASW
ncbi:MAG: hypothetical protein E6J70_17050 [Deltaproteobacteria bacterium]|nr:MAG: hypothetical protein E6J70_17050 [Deltaproteobacteria bacterium]